MIVLDEYKGKVHVNLIINIVKAHLKICVLNSYELKFC